MNWKEYQTRTANLFRQIGCSAEEDVTVQGARAKHKIDVWVTFMQFGINSCWLIECKYWRTRVTKEKAIVVKGIVEDVGADRGVIFSESGFQLGANKIASSLNIVLTSLEELEACMEDDLNKFLLDRLEKKSIELLDIMHDFYVTKRLGEGWLESYPKKGLESKKHSYFLDRIALLGHSFTVIKKEKFPIPLKFDDSGNEVIFAQNLREFIHETGAFLEQAEKWVNVQRDVFKDEDKLT